MKVQELCDPESRTHTWERSGMFLMKMADTHSSEGYISGRQVVGGLYGFFRHQTPEVEICQRCGLLRIAPAISEKEPTP